MLIGMNEPLTYSNQPGLGCLYPAIENLLDAPAFAAAIMRDHEEIAFLTRQLTTIKSEIAFPSIKPSAHRLGLLRI
jgi:hypothetical protein